MSTREGWSVEGKDERGTYLVKEVRLPDSNTRVTIRCAIVSALRPSVCLRMFSVAPLKPDEADVIASLFSGSVVWYYRDEEGGKVYFWAKSPNKVRFASLSQLEEAVISSIEAGIGGKLSKRVTYEDLINEGWLISKREWITEARRSIKLDDKLMIIDIMIDKGERDLMIGNVRVFDVSDEEGSKYKAKIHGAIGYSVEVTSISPLFHARLTRKGVVGSREENLIREIYNLAIEMVKE